MAVSPLETVASFVDAARVLLQDRLEPFRYDTDSLVLALNLALSDARRLRPDFFLHYEDFEQPPVSITDTWVEFPHFYKSALVYYMVGFAQLRDEEDSSDARAAALMQKFSGTLLGGQALVQGYSVVQ
jgi:hypothetical protein